MAGGVPTPLLRLLPLLLLLLPPGLREHLSPAISRRPKHVTAAAGGVNDDELLLHPIVLFPGVSCSELEARLTQAYRPSVPSCGAMKGKGWFGLWTNVSELPAHHYVQCFMEQMSLVYDPATNDYRNLPGVETRVANFGSSLGFQRNPDHPNYCLDVLRHELERIGYRDRDTLLGAPYDLRRAPPHPGQSSSEVFSRYFRQLTRLVEDASRRNQGKKVILFGHSFGGTVALEFVRSTPLEWRGRYIKHLILVAPLTAGGFVEPVKNLASGTNVLNVPTATPLSLRPMWRTFESAIVNLPSPAVFGHKPIVITERRNYSAYDMADFFAAIGFGDGVQPFKKREFTSMDSFQAPMVPTTCINGVGNETTTEQLVYWESDFDAEPELVYGSGDGAINLISMLAFDDDMRRHPEQREQFKSVKLDGGNHGRMLTDDWSLKRVMQEIMEANGISG